MQQGRSPIIIDNTNIQAWEMKPYVSMNNFIFKNFFRLNIDVLNYFYFYQMCRFFFKQTATTHLNFSHLAEAFVQSNLKQMKTK
uniref:Uncharacterized protein n=1 Tax=Takifugu rubripes TaxID=31033 RepID=A0A674MEX8_TAKRU